MLNGTDSKEGIYGDRPFIYGPFRLPELAFQPVGGLNYPKRRTMTNESLGDMMAAVADSQSQARATGYGQASYTRVTRVETGGTVFPVSILDRRLLVNPQSSAISWRVLFCCSRSFLMRPPRSIDSTNDSGHP